MTQEGELDTLALAAALPVFEAPLCACRHLTCSTHLLSSL
jgi:hypothetical protein